MIPRGGKEPGSASPKSFTNIVMVLSDDGFGWGCDTTSSSLKNVSSQ